MQIVLFTVFRTDSVEKINIWVSTRENLSSSRLISAYSATENSYNIKKNRVASRVACVLCLPHGAVGLSGVYHRGIF